MISRLARQQATSRLKWMVIREVYKQMTETEQTMALESQYVLQTYARAPFVLERGQGCWVYDTEGRSYLDCVAGIAVNALGHAHPDLVAARVLGGGQSVGLARLNPTNLNAGRVTLMLTRPAFEERDAEGAKGNAEGAKRFLFTSPGVGWVSAA